MDAMRSLPLPDWREQEPIREALDDQIKQAAITKSITISRQGKAMPPVNSGFRGATVPGDMDIFLKKYSILPGILKLQMNISVMKSSSKLI